MKTYRTYEERRNKNRVVFLGKNNQVVNLICCLPYNVGATGVLNNPNALSVLKKDTDYIKEELKKVGFEEEI